MPNEEARGWLGVHNGCSEALEAVPHSTTTVYGDKNTEEREINTNNKGRATAVCHHAGEKPTNDERELVSITIGCKTNRAMTGLGALLMDSCKDAKFAHTDLVFGAVSSMHIGKKGECSQRWWDCPA